MWLWFCGFLFENDQLRVENQEWKNPGIHAKYEFSYKNLIWYNL